MPVSISDVAKRAGVSAGTVSHVLNGNTRAGIAVATQARVRQAASDLGYQPNHMARSLGRRRTDTLGLFVSGLDNPFFVRVLASAEQFALEAGYHVLVDAAPRYLEASRHRAKLRGWPMDGILMWAEPQQTLSDYLGNQADGLPVVYLGGQPRYDNGDTVYFDVYAGARTAMQHLVERGYRRIAYLFPYYWVLQQPDEPRRRAYEEVCQEVGLTPQMILMDRQEQSRHGGRDAGMAIARMSADERPEALLCFNDIVAEGVLFGLRRGGLRVPEDIAIVGFDGLEETQYLDTPLTTVHMSAEEEMSREALRVLLDRIKDGKDAPPQIVTIPTKLIVGETTR